MNAREKDQTEVSASIVVLGVASIETKGGPGFGEPLGTGGPMIPGISEE